MAEGLCLVISFLEMQGNDVPLPLLLDFHGWTENSMGHENDGHNFFQVDCRSEGDFNKLRKYEATNKRSEKFCLALEFSVHLLKSRSFCKGVADFVPLHRRVGISHIH